MFIVFFFNFISLNLYLAAQWRKTLKHLHCDCVCVFVTFVYYQQISLLSISLLYYFYVRSCALLLKLNLIKLYLK